MDTPMDTAAEPPTEPATTGPAPDPGGDDGGGPLVEWVSGPHRGVVPVTAGGVVTLRLAGQPVLDLDLNNGGIGLWIDGRTRVQVALIIDDDPTPARHLSAVDDPTGQPPNRHDTPGEPR